MTGKQNRPAAVTADLFFERPLTESENYVESGRKMTQKNDENDENQDNNQPGFQFNFPFGLGWIRGDGSHVALLMPALKWALIVSTALYLALRVIQEWKAT